LLTINFIFILIYCVSDRFVSQKFVTVYNKCLKIPPSTLVHSGTRVRRSRIVRLGWSKVQASNSSRVSTFLL